MSFVRKSNDKLAAKYDDLAVEYMRHGEALGVRWDFAFFQMLLETGHLKYTGDVKPEQNNFAGLGATGKGTRGESFKDISTGTRAHIEHLLVYAGEKVESPTAVRTRNIQDWNVLTPWLKSTQGPITFAQLAKQWAPTSKSYGRDISSIADRFFDGPCKDPDPAPEMVAMARGQTPSTDVAVVNIPQQNAPTKDAVSQKKAAVLTAAIAGSASNPASGDTPPAAQKAATNETKPSERMTTQPENKTSAAPLKVLNGQGEATAADAADAGAVAEAPADKKASSKVETAALSSQPKPDQAGAQQAAAEKTAVPTCRVWTASYGGAKAVIIKAANDKTTNYTVLDVNEGAEKREADAYIAAYAQGGQMMAEFANPNEALNKAFELCPEG
jgi:hypothetical protein